MPGNPGPVGSPLLGDISRRWRAADPLLPEPVVPEPLGGCGAIFAVPGADGQPQVVGACEHWQGPHDSLDLSWGAARRFQLTARVGGPDVAAGLDQLLELWRVHLAAISGADDADSAAVVMWPSRDIDGIATLLRRGFAPRGVVAARAALRRPADPASSARLPSPVDAAGFSSPVRADPTACEHVAPPLATFDVRRAGPGDIDTVVRLGLEVIRYDAHFGGVVKRPTTAAALRAETAAMLAEPMPWTWLAERDGDAIGVLIGERPPVPWIAPLSGVAPVAYNMLTFVSAADRGTGVAAALVRSFHDAADAAGVPVTLLHYEQTNPLSAPFWARQGYRPLWTSWEARPARTVR
jgi:GNAT superfamily N-acetyltransferase